MKCVCGALNPVWYCRKCLVCFCDPCGPTKGAGHVVKHGGLFPTNLSSSFVQNIQENALDVLVDGLWHTIFVTNDGQLLWAIDKPLLPELEENIWRLMPKSKKYFVITQGKIIRVLAPNRCLAFLGARLDHGAIFTDNFCAIEVT